MSLTSKLTLTAACTFTVGIIGYVHYKQYSDREELHRGVLLDLERREKRKAENIYNLQQQIDLSREFKKIENNSSHIT
ncbi:protein PET117 homolog, mitochondrial [Rhynchophorus ferrugineus]|uniref:Protein PET117 homolog, mitochondrial n=1 Tax=Rhynchophorus ferrugineus TaxID=354439 RepID=A0A834IKY1_RHYFE|nr:hypothetical protein GWI33_006565 [Rhynchophorus ferrugineus]